MGDTPPPPPAAPDDASLMSKIEAVVKKVLGEAAPSAPPKGPPAAGDIAAQVEAAVKVVREGDAAAVARAKEEERLAAIEQKLAAQPEKKPKEYRKITQKLWGSDDDD